MSLITTDFIEALNAAIDTDDQSAVHSLVVDQLLKNPHWYTPLDWMAVGRASIAHPDKFYASWMQIEMHFFLGRKSIAPENRRAWQMSLIAARIERDDLVHVNLRENGHRDETDLSIEFLGVAVPISIYHPHPDVRNVADWSVRVLEERVGQKMGLVPATK